MAVGDVHTLNGTYSFVETGFGPFGPDVCVDCGASTNSVVPTGRIGNGGMLEDTGGGLKSRCSACGRLFRNVPAVTRPTRSVPGVPDPSDLAARMRSAVVPAPLPLPAPEHTSRDTQEGLKLPPCKGASDIHKLAQAHGWSVATRYARGPWMAKTGAVRGATHSLCVAAQHASGRAFAVTYVRMVAGDKWTAETVLMLPVDPAGLFPHAGVNDLKEWITIDGVAPAGWYENIRQRVSAQKDRQRQAAKDRPRKAREDHA